MIDFDDEVIRGPTRNMNRSEVYEEYQKVQSELEVVARSLGMTIRQLTASYSSQPESVRESIRPMLLQKVECLTKFRAWYYEDLGVLPFPLR